MQLSRIAIASQRSSGSWLKVRGVNQRRAAPSSSFEGAFLDKEARKKRETNAVAHTQTDTHLDTQHLIQLPALLKYSSEAGVLAMPGPEGL